MRKFKLFRKEPIKVNDLYSYLDDNIDGFIRNHLTEEHINNIVLAGDSVPWQFGLNYVFTPSRVWAKPCEGPNNFYSQKV